jgi:hypothetical protein
LILSSADDWYALFTAVGLVMWRKFAEELERLRAELKEKPKVVGRYAQAYAAIVAALRTYGLSDLADKVIAMLENRERRDETLELFASTISNMWNDVVAKRLPEEIYIKMFQLIDGSDVFFVPLTSVVRYAASRLMAMPGDVPQVTDRVRLEESANATFKTIEQWMRRTIPQELRNDKNLLAYLQGHPALRLLLFKIRNTYGNLVWAVAVTEHIAKTLTILETTNDIETTMAVFCTIRRRICEEVDLPQKEQICRSEECEDLLQQQQQNTADAERQPAGVQQQSQQSAQQQGSDTQQHSSELSQRGEEDDDGLKSMTVSEVLNILRDMLGDDGGS